MAISSDLFQAVLSLDVYNRGYNEGLNVSGTQLGTASLILGTDLPDGSEDASFFAQAYTLADGSITIAYRGSDGNGDLADSVSIALADNYDSEQVGDGRALAPALKQLSETVFKDKQVKLVAQGEGGKANVTCLHEAIDAKAL